MRALAVVVSWLRLSVPMCTPQEYRTIQAYTDKFSKVYPPLPYT